MGIRTSTPSGSVTYGTTAGTAAQGNDSRIVGALQAADSYLGQHSLLAANGDPGSVTGNVTLTAGTVYACRVVAGISGNCTRLLYNVQTGMVGGTAAQNLLGLASASGTLLQTSDDQTTNMGGTGNKTATITSTALVAGTAYYILVLSNFATSGPAISRFSNAPFSNVNLSGAALRWSIVATTQTALASFTPASNTTSTTCIAAAAAT